MKKFLLVNVWAILIGCSLLGCQENERVLYAEKPAVYFSSVTEEDSLFYSFASGLTDEDVVSIPVRIIGTSVDKDRSVSIAVDPESTAKKGVHYKDVGESVLLKAGSVETDIQVTVMNKELENGDVKLILDLKPSEDFDLGYAFVIILWSIFKGKASFVYPIAGFRFSESVGLFIYFAIYVLWAYGVQLFGTDPHLG